MSPSTVMSMKPIQTPAVSGLSNSRFTCNAEAGTCPARVSLPFGHIESISTGVSENWSVITRSSPPTTSMSIQNWTVPLGTE